MVGTFGWTLRVHLRPLLRPAKGGERSPYIYLCVCCLCGFVYVSIWFAYVYMYIKLFEIPVSSWATIEFFCQYWTLGLDASKFSDPSLSLCPHFFRQTFLVSRLANIRGFWFALICPRNTCELLIGFVLGGLLCFLLLHSSFPGCYLILHHRYGWQCLCIHLEITYIYRYVCICFGILYIYIFLCCVCPSVLACLSACSIWK